MLTLTKGQQLSDRFTLLKPLGLGGMGEVWLARDQDLGVGVALKVLNQQLSASPGMIEVLRNECRNARRLIHPNIVRVFDLHHAGQYHFISMQYIEGRDFQQFRGRSCAEFLPALLPVIDALEYSHGLGIIHRDLKASNILCDAAGTAHLTDFGIAAVISADENALDITTGGSLYSMSPQQVARQTPTPADDIYAMGALLYDLITGHPPFHPAITPEKITSQAPPPMQVDFPVPAAIESLVYRMLAKAPEDRPAGMAEVKVELDSFVEPERNITAPPELAVLAVEEEREPQPEFERITPVSPAAAREQPGPVPMQGRRTVPAGLAWLALAILVAAAVGVFYYLPKRVETPVTVEPVAGPAPSAGQQTSPAPASAPGRTQAPGPYELAQQNRDRQKAERIVAQLLRKFIALEDRGVAIWAAEEFATAQATAEAGDESARARDYPAAIASYEKAAALADELTERVARVFGEALQRGQEALESADQAAATEAFELALAIDAGHSGAQRGLARARVVDQVAALLRSAAQYEQRGDLELARRDYREATELDSDSQTAQAGLRKVNARIANREFNRAMSAGFSALERGEFAAARDAFGRARKLKPASTEPADGLAQVDLAVRLQQIAGHREKAESLEGDERWREASEQYSAALELEPTLVFAKQGRSRTLARAQLAEQLNIYIAEPQRLGAESVYKQAKVLIGQARLIPNQGPQLREQIAALERQLKLARTPVRIRLESDNRTQVVVYKVGQLGSFETRELELHPGTYTVVGTRAGYRDVRRQFTVVPGQAPAQIVVRCEEKI